MATVLVRAVVLAMGALITVATIVHPGFWLGAGIIAGAFAVSLAVSLVQRRR